MMNAAAVAQEDLADGATHLNSDMAFSDIKLDEASQFNNVFCPVANENFRSGESVDLEPAIPIPGTNYRSQVGAILRVSQQGTPQTVLLSLFINVIPEMGVAHQDSPDDRDYVQYPTQQVAWTRYQGWYPVTRVWREVLLSPHGK